MNLYTNGFRLAVRADSKDVGEVVLHFVQNGPIVGDDGTVSQNVTEPVTSIVMNLSTARALASSLSDALNKPKDD